MLTNTLQFNLSKWWCLNTPSFPIPILIHAAAEPRHLKHFQAHWGWIHSHYNAQCCCWQQSHPREKPKLIHPNTKCYCLCSCLGSLCVSQKQHYFPQDLNPAQIRCKERAVPIPVSYLAREKLLTGACWATVFPWLMPHHHVDSGC